MSDFATTWNLSRQRFETEIKDLNDDQLRWRLHPTALSIGQMAIHLAGVEVSFVTQLLGETLSDEDQKLKSASSDGVVNDAPFPYPDAEITRELVQKALDTARAKVEPLIGSPTPEILVKEIKSALGPIVSGEGAFARLSIHPAYHQGQAYLIKNASGFPT